MYINDESLELTDQELISKIRNEQKKKDSEIEIGSHRFENIHKLIRHIRDQYDELFINKQKDIRSKFVTMNGRELLGNYLLIESEFKVLQENIFKLIDMERDFENTYDEECEY